MKTVLLIIKANLQRHWGKSVLTSVSIILLTLLLTTALGILNSIQKPFDRIFEKAKASHLLLLFDNRNNDVDKIKQWFSRQPEVERVAQSNPYWHCNGPIYHKTNKIELMLQLTEYVSDNQHQDCITVLAGSNTLAFGQIWIPNYLAKRHQISVGDTLNFSTKTGKQSFIVGALISDPHYGSGMVNPSRAWVAAGSLAFFLDINELQQVTLGIRFKDIGKAQAIWENFVKELDYVGTSLSYDMFKSAYMSMYQIIGLVLLLFSLMALLVAVFLLRESISRSIKTDFQLTGIYRTLGLSPGNLIAIYTWQYIFLSMFSIMIGFVLTVCVLQYAFQLLRDSLGNFEAELALGPIFCISTFVILISVLINAYFIGRRWAKIKPVLALRNEPEIFKQINSRINFFHRGFNNISFMLGGHMLFSDVKKNMSSLLIAGIALFVAAFSVNISHSFTQLRHNKPAWGFDMGDLNLHRNEAHVIALNHTQLLNLLASYEEVASVTPYSFRGISILSSEGDPIQEIYGKVYSGNLDTVGLVNLAGRHPINAAEISLCINTLLKYKKRLGDSIGLQIDGIKAKFLITGYYQDVSNLGQGFRMHEQALLPFNPLHQPGFYTIRLKNTKAKEQFKAKLLSTIGEAISLDNNIEDQLQQMGIITNMKLAMNVLLGFFMLVLVLSIASDIQQSTWQHRKAFGIYRSIGFTSTQMLNILAWKNLFIVLIASLISIPLSLHISPKILNLSTGQIGLVKFPYVVNYVGTALIWPLAVLVVIATVWLCGRSMFKEKTMRLISVN